MRNVDGETARAAIAALLLPEDREARCVGDVELWPRQRLSVARAACALEELGGALLADDVGSGKTFVALALARSHARPLVVAPAALRDVWRRAMERALTPLPFVSIESLSRSGCSPPRDADLVIVDEAHHARNPATRRYDALARLTANARVLLLTATPIHNGQRDLVALLALFLGAHAAALDDATLARCVIRTSGGTTARVPRVDGPSALPLDYDDREVAERILTLPPAVPPSDGGVAHALVALGLLRRWSSSDGALRASLRRRIADGEALADALATGRHLTRRDLAMWTLSGDVQQLALPGLLASPAIAGAGDDGTRKLLTRHIDALRELLRHSRARPSPDVARADALASLLRARRGEKVIAFTQFAETASAYWSLLRGIPRIGMLTASGATIAGGRVSRTEALRRFAPRALGASPAGAADRIDCLLTTDILSEGLDLQDAGVVVHLDQPWTPARLEQRVGRAVRPGSFHARVLVRTIPPPMRADELLRMHERLTAKLEAARTALGDVMGVALGTRGSAAAPSAPVTRGAAAMRTIEGWRRPVRVPDHPFVATVEAAWSGWLAVVERAAATHLVACVDGTVGDQPELVARACELATGADIDAGGAASSALAAIDRWLRADDAAHLVGATHIGIVGGRRALSRAAASAARLARSRREQVATAADVARALSSGGGGVGRERELALLAAHGLDAMRLEAPEAFSGRPPSRPFTPGRLLGVIVFVAR